MSLCGRQFESAAKARGGGLSSTIALIENPATQPEPRRRIMRNAIDGFGESLESECMDNNPQTLRWNCAIKRTLTDRCG